MLKLAALDEDDLKVVSAHVQDAAIKVGDIRWDRDAGRLFLEMNRFVWEKKQRFMIGQRYERRRSILHFDGVKALRASGISPNKPDEVLVLLSVGFDPAEAPAGTVQLTFAGPHAMRIDVDFIEARLTDLGAAWETRSKPAHNG